MPPTGASIHRPGGPGGGCLLDARGHTRRMLRYAAAATLGVVTVLVLVSPWSSPWLLGGVALSVVVLMPRVPPRLFGAFALGAVAAFLVFAVVWARGWNGAEEVRGLVVDPALDEPRTWGWRALRDLPPTPRPE